MIATLARRRQIDFHQPVVVVLPGEAQVLVSKARWGCSEPLWISSISSFLGVQPGDEVEMAVDVVDTDTQDVLYSRSIHKETRGIYDAWDRPLPVEVKSKGLEVVITCRVNGPNRDGLDQALFEGLVRVTFGEVINGNL